MGAEDLVGGAGWEVDDGSMGGWEEGMGAGFGIDGGDEELAGFDEPGFGFGEVVVEGAVGIGEEVEDFEGIEGAVMDPEFMAPGFGMGGGLGGWRIFHVDNFAFEVTAFGEARADDIAELLAGDVRDSPSFFRLSPGIFHV
jgi:hypothetical protein